jgi:hypothetical protein
MEHPAAPDSAEVISGDKEDRRATDAITAKLLEMVDRLQHKVLEHMATEALVTQGLIESVARVEAKADQFMAAFPDNDHRSHRVYHELLIAEARYKKEFWRKLLYDLMRLGALGFLVWAGYALWKAFLLGPK